MKKILFSLLTVAGVATLAFGATQAFFSDTETSTGNILQAGALDLKIGNTAYYNDAQVQESTWSLSDLTNELFFNFNDLKPGDWGESTIDLDVNTNMAWACANVDITEDSDNGITEPEDDVDGISNNSLDGTPDGDLDTELHFAFWNDDGDNVLETDETVAITGPASSVLGGATLALADYDSDFFGVGAGYGLDPNTTYHIGQYWCYGTMTQDKVTEDGVNSPLDDPGFNCDGSAVTSRSQTDRLMGNMKFYVEQHRNNPEFQCTDALFPSATPTPVPSISQS